MRMIALSLTAAVRATVAHADNVSTYHNGGNRHGAYIVPALTPQRAAGMHLDPGFAANTLSGTIHAQPLFYHPKIGTPRLIVATDNNAVYALDPASGAVAWQQNLPSSVPVQELGCGNINPEGILGTPVIDQVSGTLFLDALVQTSNGPKQQLYALALANGAVRPGYPIDVETALAAKGITFSSTHQGERSAALAFGGKIYFVYGGRSGDCDPYRGTVLELDPSGPTVTGAWATRASRGGIWSQGGIATDGKSLFITTGNTEGASSWGDGEAIERLKPGLAHSTSPADYFAPANWQQLDNDDLDLGGTEALPLAVVDSSGDRPRAIAFGKDGNAYLVNRSNLGGIGGQIAVQNISGGEIITGPAIYESAGKTIVALTNPGNSHCGGENIAALTVTNAASAPITQLWCQSYSGNGSPIVTTTDGASNPIIWLVGAEGDNALHGWNLADGSVAYAGRDQLAGLHHFQTLISAEGRLYVAADNRVYAFTY